MEKESFLNFINGNEVFKLNRKRDIFNFNNGKKYFIINWKSVFFNLYYFRSDLNLFIDY
jgi:hypothetical protein